MKQPFLNFNGDDKFSSGENEFICVLNKKNSETDASRLGENLTEVSADIFKKELYLCFKNDKTILLHIFEYLIEGLLF